MIAALMSSTAISAAPFWARCALGVHDWARAFHVTDVGEEMGKKVFTGFDDLRCRVCRRWHTMVAPLQSSRV